MQRARSPTMRGSIMESINMVMVEQSRSSAFGYTLTSPTTETPPTKYLGEGPDSLSSSPLESHIPPSPTSLKPDYQQEDAPTSPKTCSDSMEVLRPFVIDFPALQVAQTPTEAAEAGKEEESAPAGKPLPINVTSPNLLKMVLLQSSELSDITVETRPMDLISLSGVVLCNQRGVWHIQHGCNFHDGLPFNSDGHTEMFNLSGGIKAIYNHTHKRWHVLPPGPSGGYDDRSISSSIEHAQGSSLEQSDGSVSSSSVNQLYLAKKVIVTEVGSAFHDIMALFGKTRDNAEKQRIGSDMTNANMGHLIRGRFCSAMALLLLDGLLPYRLQGIIQDDIWDVTVAFCNAAQSDPTSSLVTPAIDKLIFQPIHSMKARIKDNNIKFRTFICLAMSKGMLTGWLEALPKQRSVLHKYYLPSSLLSLAADDAAFNALYQEMLLTLEPMIYLPFDLSIDFELRQASAVGCVAQQGVGQDAAGSGGTSLSVSGATGERPVSPQSPMRANVVIKTHAATGQRSVAGNIISAVWDTSSIHSSPGSGQDATATSPAPHHTEETDAPAERPRQDVVVSSVRADPPTSNQPQTVTSSVKKVGGSFLKKISDRFQQLNVGGAITGAPKGTPQATQNNNPAPIREPRPQRDASPAPSRGVRHVEALYTNICDETDELCFSKGDLLVVKEQINSEWLICSHGNRTGMVPMNYIKPVPASH